MHAVHYERLPTKIIFQTLSIAEEEKARNEANFYALLFLLIGIVAALSMFMQVVSWNDTFIIGFPLLSWLYMYKYE